VRDRRKSDVEERIEKTPVKMIIPIGTLVLPAMLLAIMGPLFASLMQVA
jgi:tight adherence protein C